MIRRTTRVRTLAVAVVLLLSAAPARAQAPVAYRLSFPVPEHHWMQVDVTFSGVGQDALQVWMSRSSPGRYALHEFAKNVYDVRAYDGTGKELFPTRPNPYAWDVSAHDGTVRMVYKVYGDRVDGTYLAVDTTHAHVNLPAAIMWAKGLEDRPVRVHIEPPAGSNWKVATQLYPTNDPYLFTAPNLQYLMDSPIEVSNFTWRTFTVPDPADGTLRMFRLALHHEGSEPDVDAFVVDIGKIVREQAAIFGELPEYEPGAYTLIADYLSYASGDGMEHRNSTVLTSRTSLGSRGQRLGALGTVSHEIFHCWNVERIRPRGLEPFNFQGANRSESLWLAEGFTSYYGPLAMVRAGITNVEQTLFGFGRTIDAVVNGPGRQFHSAAEMSELATFVDGAPWADRTNLGIRFISYYTFGAAIALGLDLTLRDMSDGKVTLDDFMRAMWRAHGRPGGAAPGLVAKPYTLRDARDQLAEVSGSRSFANEFFDRYIEGREVVDYGRLLARAGFVLRKRRPGAAWMGHLDLDFSSGAAVVASLTAPGSPAYEAGLDQDDLIKTLDGEVIASAARLQEWFAKRKPGDRVTVEFVRRGQPVTATMTLAEDPSLDVVTLESSGETLSDAQKAFRDAWLGSGHRPK